MELRVAYMWFSGSYPSKQALFFATNHFIQEKVQNIMPNLYLFPPEKVRQVSQGLVKMAGMALLVNLGCQGILEDQVQLESKELQESVIHLPAWELSLEENPKSHKTAFNGSQKKGTEYLSKLFIREEETAL